MSWEVRVSRATVGTDDESNGEKWSTVPSIFGGEKKRARFGARVYVEDSGVWLSVAAAECYDEPQAWHRQSCQTARRGRGVPSLSASQTGQERQTVEVVRAG